MSSCTGMHVDGLPFIREFQEEVEERARRELVEEVEFNGASSAPQYQATSAYSDAPIYRSNGKGFGSKPPVVITAPPDLQVSTAPLKHADAVCIHYYPHPADCAQRARPCKVLPEQPVV